MANRYPLIVDTSDGNKIKELPTGDNLNLSGCGIVNAASIAVSGSITANSITVGGQALANIATSGSFNDLSNVPTLFNGDYNFLINKPTIPTITTQLSDISATSPSVGEALVWNGIEYAPSSISPTIDLSTHNIDELQNVITTGDTTNKFFKYYSGAWRAANIDWADVQNKPSSVEAQTLNLVGTTLSISDGNSVDLSSVAGNSFNQDLNTTDIVEFAGVSVAGPLSVTDGALVNWNFAAMDDSGTALGDGSGVILMMEPNGTYNAITGNNTLIDLGVNATIDGSGTLQWGNIYTSNTSRIELGLNVFDAGMYQTANIISLAGETPILTGMDMGGQIGWQPASLEQLIQSNVSGIGNFTLSSSTIDTDDSSAITITPAVVMSSDLTVENDLTVNNDLTVTGVLEAQTFSSGGTGSSELVSATNLELTAGNAVVVTQSPLRMASFTTTQRDALAAQNGDIIYNTTDNKFQGYENGAWVNLV